MKRAIVLAVIVAACAGRQGGVKSESGTVRGAKAAAVEATPGPTGAAVRARADDTAAAAAAAKKEQGAPASRVEPVAEVIFGVTVKDPYRWLEDASSPEVQSWMKAQDAYARAKLGALPGREALVARLKQLSYLEVESAPLHRGKHWFYSHRAADQEKSTVVFKDKSGAERVLLDPNKWSTDGSIALGDWSPSWDGSKVAYQRRANNSDEATLELIDVATGKVSAIDAIEGAKYASASWTARGDGFYYTWVPTDPKIAQTDRTGYSEVRFHRVGTDPKGDRLVRGASHDPKTFVNCELSRDGHWLLLTLEHGWTSSDIWFKDARKPRAQWTVLVSGRDAIYEVQAWKDRFYLRTNDGAGKWRVLRADPRRPARENWSEIVPQRDDATLDSMNIVGNRLGLGYLKDVTSHLEIHALDGKLVREVALPGLGAASGFVGNEDEDEAYYVFTSFLFPPEIFRTSVRTGASSVYFKLKVPVDPSPYVTDQVFFSSKDGTRVPMFVVHRKDMKADGTTPTLLTGYGGFQVSNTPSFSASIYAWLERGGAYALANIRGGSEYGEEWHRHGMLLEKQHVFDDFIGAAEKLVSDGVTRPGLLAIAGASNGGLLMGAAETQRPDLFRVVLCGVPLLDMIRYTLYGQAKAWVPEYGSAEDPEQFKALYAYSPYHHVNPATAYPATLILSADADDRVDPMHARKFAAALQAAQGGPVLLRIEKHSGHGGADLVHAQVEKLADEYAFAFANFVQPAAASASAR